MVSLVLNMTGSASICSCRNMAINNKFISARQYDSILSAVRDRRRHLKINGRDRSKMQVYGIFAPKIP